MTVIKSQMAFIILFSELKNRHLGQGYYTELRITPGNIWENSIAVSTHTPFYVDCKVQSRHSKEEKEEIDSLELAMLEIIPEVHEM